MVNQIRIPLLASAADAWDWLIVSVSLSLYKRMLAVFVSKSNDFVHSLAALRINANRLEADPPWHEEHLSQSWELREAAAVTGEVSLWFLGHSLPSISYLWHVVTWWRTVNLPSPEDECAAVFPPISTFAGSRRRFKRVYAVCLKLKACFRRSDPLIHLLVGL